MRSAQQRLPYEITIGVSREQLHEMVDPYQLRLNPETQAWFDENILAKYEIVAYGTNGSYPGYICVCFEKEDEMVMFKLKWHNA